MSIHLLEFFNKFPCILFISRFIWLHNKLFAHWVNLMHHAGVCLSRLLSSLTTLLSWLSPHKYLKISSPCKWHSFQAYTTSYPAISVLWFEIISRKLWRFLFNNLCLFTQFLLKFKILTPPKFKKYDAFAQMI